jgi:hypothetical protein
MASRPTPDFEALIAAVARELAARDIPFMLTDGQAVLLHWAEEFAAIPGREALPTSSGASGPPVRKGAVFESHPIHGRDCRSSAVNELRSMLISLKEAS